ncbi:glucose/quinate/shikimate family membrane-bound PQQ-dependent dehydrogenase [soil metagenome]
MKRLVRLLAIAGLLLAPAVTGVQAAKPAAPARATSTLKVYDPGQWRFWGGDSGQTRYAPLDQINATNVSRLKIAWRWTAETAGSALANNYKSTPLMVDGVLYVPWLNHGAAAIDPGTGKTIWTFEPPPGPGGAGSGTLAPRSLAYWTDGKQKRLFHNSLDGRLIAIDAVTGKAAAGFGKSGIVDLRVGLTENREVKDVRSVSPAIVVGDVVVTQSLPGGARNKEATPGDIRGFDARTGRQVWQFHVVPQPGEFGNETWKNDSWKYVGNSGTWTMMSADPELGYVYIAGDTPSNDFSGVERPGDGLFAETLTCINAKTGKRVWHFQTVHHGVWDYDNPAAPILHDIIKDGKRIRAVTQLTKQGFVFVFDRVTGKPIWPIEERPVPQSKVPGEQTSPTQPFPTRPGPIMPQGYSEDRLIDFTPELHAEAIKMMEAYEKGPLFTPPVEAKGAIKGTFVYPGFGGGANWNGAAIDPVTGVMYIPIRHRPSAVGLAKGDPARTNMAYVQVNNTTVVGPRGLPMLKPPYSELVAMDMNRGQQIWRVPNGGAPDDVRNNPALKGLNLDFDHMGQVDIRPGPLLTKTLLFMGESGTIAASRGGSAFRAYDKKSGKTVWQMALPTLSTGAPLTYVHKGRQYIVIAVAAPGKPAEMIALTLDGQSENGAPPPGGVPVAAAPQTAAAAVGAMVVTAAEMALGKAAYDRVCASCHGATGAGDIGPGLIGRTAVANIARVIAQGQGEMPAMGSTLSPAEVDAVAKYLVRGFPAPARPRPGAGRGGADD